MDLAHGAGLGLAEARVVGGEDDVQHAREVDRRSSLARLIASTLASVSPTGAFLCCQYSLYPLKTDDH